MFIYTFIIYGLTNIITQSTIFEPFRDKMNDRNEWLGLLVNCPMCMGFWVGIFVLICGLSPIRNFVDIMPINILNNIIHAVIVGSVASGIAWFMHNLVSLIGFAADYLRAASVVQEYNQLKKESMEEVETIILND